METRTNRGTRRDNHLQTTFKLNIHRITIRIENNKLGERSLRCPKSTPSKPMNNQGNFATNL